MDGIHHAIETFANMLERYLGVFGVFIMLALILLWWVIPIAIVVGLMFVGMYVSDLVGRIRGEPQEGVVVIESRHAEHSGGSDDDTGGSFSQSNDDGCDGPGMDSPTPGYGGSI